MGSIFLFLSTLPFVFPSQAKLRTPCGDCDSYFSSQALTSPTDCEAVERAQFLALFRAKPPSPTRLRGRGEYPVSSSLLSLDARAGSLLDKGLGG
jgi:hypothetical protein